MQESSSSPPLTDSAEWPSVQTVLDEVPVFTMANEEKKPLQYQVNGQPMAMFYADVNAAMDQLYSIKKQYPDIDNDLVPVGLGAAYKMSCEGKACLVPGVPELTEVGMPEGMSAVGQELPLFACMEISKETDDGDAVTPLYMSYADCEAAVKEAEKVAETEDDDPLEVVGLSLPSVVEHFLSVKEGKPKFAFVTPSRTNEHLSSYVGSGVYARLVDEEEEAEKKD